MSTRTTITTALAVVATTAFGGIAAAAAGSGDDPPDSTTASADATPALFDSSVVHDIEVSFDDDAYEAMIDNFKETGEKQWIEATVTIDGVTYEDAGMRLKGNSSLGGLGLPGLGEPAGSAPLDCVVFGDEDSDGEEDGDDGEPVGDDGFEGPPDSAGADEPEQLPWLIRLDKFTDGQEHQDYEDIVIRSNDTATSLNEALAVALLEQAGLASQQAAATSFRVNDGDAALRLALEHPSDDAWYERVFDGEGALYKAEAGGNWGYHGDDPDAYDDVWDQEGGDSVADFTPLIEFLQFINESDDATFAAELPERLDVEAFATYLAMMELIGNWDDISGPGNNAYLWFDPATDQFTVAPWDMNLALMEDAFGPGPGDAVGDPDGRSDGSSPDEAERPAGGGVGRICAGPGETLPDDVEAPGGAAGPDGSDPDGPSFGPGELDNPLVTRFKANAEFNELYEQALADLRAELYESGVADEILATWVETLSTNATDLVDQETITTEAAAVAEHFVEE